MVKNINNEYHPWAKPSSSTHPFIQAPGSGGSVAGVEIHDHNCAPLADLEDFPERLDIGMVLRTVGVSVLVDGNTVNPNLLIDRQR